VVRPSFRRGCIAFAFPKNDGKWVAAARTHRVSLSGAQNRALAFQTSRYLQYPQNLRWRAPRNSSRICNVIWPAKATWLSPDLTLHVSLSRVAGQS